MRTMVDTCGHGRSGWSDRLTRYVLSSRARLERKDDTEDAEGRTRHLWYRQSARCLSLALPLTVFVGCFNPDDVALIEAPTSGSDVLPMLDSGDGAEAANNMLSTGDGASTSSDVGEGMSIGDDLTAGSGASAEGGLADTGGSDGDAATGGTSESCGTSGGCSSGPAEVDCAPDEIFRGGACRRFRTTSVLRSDSNGVRDAVVAPSESGNVLVAWNERINADTLNSHLFARVYDATSGSWTPAVQLDNANSTSSAEVFAEGPSSFVVLWTEYLGGIRSRHWNGNAWGSIVNVVDIDPIVINVSRDGYSRGVVGWSTYEDTTGLYFVRTRFWDSSSDTWGPVADVQVSSLSVNSVTTAVTRDGQAFAVWNRTPESGTDFDMYASRFHSGSWDTAQFIGHALQRQSGYELFITEQGNLLAYWAGKMKGIIFDAETQSWGTLTTDGTSLGAAICSIGGEDALLIGRTEDALWYRRWSDGFLSSENELHDSDPFMEPVLGCSEDIAFAAWGDNDPAPDYVRWWDKNSGTWSPETVLSAGFPMSVAAASNGTAFLVRGVDQDSETLALQGLVVEHFE